MILFRQPTVVARQVYKAVLRDTGQEVAIKVQRPNVEPIIFRDLFIFRQLVGFYIWQPPLLKPLHVS